jgi:hypothetical protein
MSGSYRYGIRAHPLHTLTEVERTHYNDVRTPRVKAGIVR